MSLRMRVLLASAAVMLIVVPGIAVAGARTGGDTDDDAQLIADARQSQRALYAAYNDKRWDDLRPLFAEDAIMLPPNHKPIRGRDAIIEFVRSGRDVVGEIAPSGIESARVKVSGKLVNFVYEFTAQSGRVRLMSRRAV